MGTQLWTDKYSPKRIIDLLSAEKINREVTTWVKEWDHVVFGGKYRRHDKHEKAAQKNNKKKKEQNVYSVRNNMPMFGNERKNIRMATILRKRSTRVDPKSLCFYFVGHLALAR